MTCMKNQENRISVCVVGGGAAGLVAAITAAENGADVTLFEKNKSQKFMESESFFDNAYLGKKLLITGKGRCNVTNNCDIDTLISNVSHNGKFLYSAFNSLSAKDTYDMFEEWGVPLKTERGNRVFPSSDKASDITKTLEIALKNNNVKIIYNTVALDVLTNNGKVIGVKTNKGDFPADSVIIATGGKSYPTTGSTGDGYNIANKLGHKIIDIVPALNGITVKYPIKNANKLILKNVNLTAKKGDRLLFSEQGEVMLTDYGISGPIAITCSSYINRQDLLNVKLYLDFKPALDKNKLINRLNRDFTENFGMVKDVLRKLLPKELIIPVLIKAGIQNNKYVNLLSQNEVAKICDTIKNYVLLPTSIRPIDEAIVTAGGVDVKKVSNVTLESKLVKGLYFAGEVLDIDALTGGFNIQLALSTGYLAGLNA